MDALSEQTAIITDIQRFSVHDGPGIRTIVFFKGCPLRCKWCQNPETWSPKPEIMCTPSVCIHCGACEAACPTGAARLTENGITVDVKTCRKCGACLKTCYSGALRMVGKAMTVSEVLNAVAGDWAFYGKTGGITLSGGEVLMHAEFASELLCRARAYGLNTAVETCGFAPWSELERLLPDVDLFLYDVKHMNSEIHRQYTGQGNELILKNLEKLRAHKKALIIRVPFIVGVNDSEENIRSTGALAKRLGVEMIHLLPFHQMGEGKWNGLGREYAFANAALPEAGQVEHAAEILRSMGVSANIGGYQY